MVPPAVAAGHPATCAAGIEILADGGSAADAAVAACLASCVAETVMTGLLGGGHAIHLDAGERPGREPRLLRRRCRAGPAARWRSSKVPFGEELVHYAVGAASCGVPGVAGGARRAVALARAAALGAARRAGAAARARRRADAGRPRRLPGDAGARDDDARGRADLRARRAAARRGRAAAPAGPRRGARAAGRGGRARAPTPARSPRRCSTSSRNGAASSRATDLAGYRARWRVPVEAELAGHRFLTRGGLSRLPETLDAAAAALRARAFASARARALEALEPAERRGAHDQPLRRRRRRRRVRPDDEPRARARATGCPASTCT